MNLPPERDIRPFVRYNDAGRVTGSGSQAIIFTYAEPQAILGGTGLVEDTDRLWVEFVEGAPVVRERLPLDILPDATSVKVGQTVSLANLPSAIVRYSGPLNGTIDHQGPAKLSFGWTVPGTYTVTIEAFPRLPATHVITVSA